MVMEAAGVELINPLILRKLLVLQAATSAKKGSLPGRRYKNGTKSCTEESARNPHHSTQSTENRIGHVGATCSVQPYAPLLLHAVALLADAVLAAGLHTFGDVRVGSKLDKSRMFPKTPRSFQEMNETQDFAMPTLGCDGSRRMFGTCRDYWFR